MDKFYAKEEFKHDYGLVIVDDHRYCINNEAKDFRIK